MPRELNGTVKSLALLDTGIVSEAINDRMGERNALVQLMTGEDVIPCISIWSIMELRGREDLYADFLELFSNIPLHLVWSPRDLLDEELKAYPDPSKVDPIGFAFSPVGDDPDAELPAFMERLFNKPDVKKVEESWRGDWKEQSLASMLSLRANFEPSGERFKADDAKIFIDEGVPQYIAGQAPQWTRELIETGQPLDPHAFPSVKMVFYTAFHRFYSERRQPELQDVFDILIAGAAPYMDIVFTERFQAEIFKKAKNRDPFLGHLRIETLKALRS